jgi:hypothetical protein
MKKDQLLDIIRTKNTVFTKDEIALMWGETNAEFISRKIHRFLKSNKLYSIRRGIYAKEKNYDHDELATKIYTPSYISFETVLAREGVVFQYYGNIFIASYLSREIKVDGSLYIYKKIKDTVLNNTTGIEEKDGYFIASKERALLDTIYLYRNYYFDNLLSIDWEKVNEIIPIYENKSMTANVKRLERWVKKEAKYDDVK